jgi:predicted dienelactone hydrolase
MPPTTSGRRRSAGAVGRAEVTFADASRPTDAKANRHLEPRPGCILPTVILCPASTSAAMAALVDPWVRAGSIVAAPSFPLGSGSGVDITDLPDQPADVNFVVPSMRKLADDPTQALAGHPASGCLALAGHSLGAATTLEAAFESSYRVTSVQAAFAQLPGPNYFMTFPAANHNSTSAPPNRALLDLAAIALPDAELKSGPPAGSRLTALLRGFDIATLQIKEG